VKTRQEFIETDYVEGVFNQRGEQVIRALNEEEVEWLKKFYTETEHGNFEKNEKIEKVQEAYKQYCRKIRSAKKLKLTTEEVLKLKVEADKKYKELVKLREETNTFYPEDVDRKEIWNRGNERREDIFNRAKVSNNLISLDLPEFDQFTTRAEKDISPEHLVQDYLIRKPARKVMKKRKK
jgi:hypothetical protein